MDEIRKNVKKNKIEVGLFWGTIEQINKQNLI